MRTIAELLANGQRAQALEFMGSDCPADMRYTQSVSVVEPSAVLKDFDVQTTLNALAIAGSHSAGLIEYTKTGGSVKRIHSAIPTQACVRGALFAKPDWREPGQRHTSRFDRRSDALR